MTEGALGKRSCFGSASGGYELFGSQSGLSMAALQADELLVAEVFLDEHVAEAAMTSFEFNHCDILSFRFVRRAR